MSVKSKMQAVYDIAHMQFVKNKKPFKVMSIEDTINAVINNNLSVSRFGEGEVFMMANQMNESFQTYDKNFAQRIKEVANCTDKNLMVCIHDIFGDLSHMTENALKWHRYFLRRKKYLMYRYFDVNKTYGNAFMTRCYMDLIDKTPSRHYFDLLKKIWQDREIVIIEGEYSRLGIGNDLFANAKSIERILCPAENAYKKYDEIMGEAVKFDKNKCILLALGATATVLAYDLAKIGYQAVDIGHVDVEYEWMNMNAAEKVPIPSKYVNEAGAAGRKALDLNDKTYESQIAARII